MRSAARSLGLCLLASLSARAQELPQPTFRLSFDHGLTPEICQPGATATTSGEVQYVPGRSGQALYVPAGAKVAFPSAGHLSATGGTVALWFQPSELAERPKYARLFDATDPGSGATLALMRLDNPVVWVWALARADKDQSYVPWPMGDALVRSEPWQHVALTWGPGGATLYLNGVTLCATDAMPPLAKLPELFYVGSDEGGGQSACTAIDDLAIFDRPLRSQELFALAGRDAGTDLTAGNWLANSSFETGPQPWQTYLWGDHESTAKAVEGDAHSGTHAYVVDRTAVTHTWWSTIWLVGPWLHLQRDTEVTLSAWMKADRPDVAAWLDLQVGAEGRAVKGTPASGSLRQGIRVGTEWRRYAFTTTLPISYKDGYRPRLVVEGKPCRVWLDDVQLAAGPPRDYVPAQEVEVGLASPTDEALFQRGSHVRPRLYAYFSGEGERPLDLELTRTDPRGETHTSSVPLHLRGGSATVTDLEPVDLDRLGLYRLEVEGTPATVLLAAADLRTDDPPPVDGPFGTHGGDRDVMLRLGLSQMRDVSGLNWRWTERSQGNWSSDGRLEEYLAAHRAGLGVCGTLAAAPPWAEDPPGSTVPRDPVEWEGYVRHMISDCHEPVGIFEIWNEPDLNGVFAQDPAKYVDLVKRARAVQRQVAPDRLLAGPCTAGIEDRAMKWTEEVFKLGLLDQVDLLAWHPYCHSQPEGAYLSALAAMNALMDRYGGRKPMIFTEFGTGGLSDPALWIPWAADGWRLHDEAEQAELLVRQCVLGLWQGAVKLYWYQWHEERLQTGPDTFGLVRADTYATPKPALLAYSELARQCERTTLPPSRLELPETSQWGFAFTTPAGRVQVLWDAVGTSSIPWPAGAAVYDLYGNQVRPTERLTLNGAAVYVKR